MAWNNSQWFDFSLDTFNKILNGLREYRDRVHDPKYKDSVENISRLYDFVHDYACLREGDYDDEKIDRVSVKMDAYEYADCMQVKEWASFAEEDGTFEDYGQYLRDKRKKYEEERERKKEFEKELRRKNAEFMKKRKAEKKALQEKISAEWKEYSRRKEHPSKQEFADANGFDYRDVVEACPVSYGTKITLPEGRKVKYKAKDLLNFGHSVFMSPDFRFLMMNADIVNGSQYNDGGPTWCVIDLADKSRRSVRFFETYAEALDWLVDSVDE